MRPKWLGPAAIAAIALVMTFGFCVLPGHHGELGNHGPSPALCASLTVALITGAVAFALPSLAGWAAPEERTLFSPLLTPVPHRPPEMAFPS
ncbi:MAG: hypothetical protein HY712_01770 [candidate division NC10 bacterium]|nr:hypothetical protein [candidate division NC10 bacterium]